VGPHGVILVDSLQVVRAGLALLISHSPNLDLRGEAGTSEEALTILRQTARRASAVIVVGLNLVGEHDAFWLIRTIRAEFPVVCIVACGGLADSNTISRALFVGADGYVDKNASPEEFLDALGRAAEGEIVLVGPREEWIASIADGLERQKEAQSMLTDREREVLTIAAEGVTAREIGERLGLRERTVTTHLGRIYGKLGVNSRTAAVTTAARSGLVSVANNF
jgi:DNA-binding NarL/FixJ family response regulator